MVFRIQAGQPENSAEFCDEDEKLSEAIETIFPMMTEDAMIVWNTTCIPIGYKYDVSYMIEDILCMLKTMRESPDDGTLRINWPTNSFACRWDLTWDKGVLTISLNWRSESGRTEQLSKIEVSLLEFINEWKILLEVLIRNLEQCGYDENSLRDMKALYCEYSHIKATR